MAFPQTELRGDTPVFGPEFDEIVFCDPSPRPVYIVRPMRGEHQNEIQVALVVRPVSPNPHQIIEVGTQEQFLLSPIRNLLETGLGRLGLDLILWVPLCSAALYVLLTAGPR